MRCRPTFLQLLSRIVLGAPLLLLGCDGNPHPPKSSVASGTPPAASASGEDSSAASASDSETPQRGRDPEYGQMLYGNTCLACHGTRGQGMPNQGVNLRISKFIAQSTDDQLLSFLRKGREPKDPTTLVGRLMPPRGGNGSLDDTGLGDIVAYLRQLQAEAKENGETEPPPDARQAAAR